MAAIVINRGEWTAIQFSITDAANGLAASRVTWSIGPRYAPPALTKASALPGSSAEVAIATQTPGSITGAIFIELEDFDLLPHDAYDASLWIDSGAGDDRCVTPGGMDSLSITRPVPRT